MADPLNPKDLIGATKLPLGLVPDVLVTEVSLAFLEGALKYGRYNWRAAGVRASIYHDALMRHIFKWWNGEERDATTRVRHLANAGACIAILLDAELQGKLIDDRPIAQPGLSARIDEAMAIIKHLQELFKDHNPKQYTIMDALKDAGVPTPTPETPSNVVTGPLGTTEVKFTMAEIEEADQRPEWGLEATGETVAGKPVVKRVRRPEGYKVGEEHPAGPGSTSPIKEETKLPPGWS
jgi:hypothetical protein